MKPLLLLIVSLPFISCGQPINKTSVPLNEADTVKSSYTIVDEIPLPQGYKRINEGSTSFTTFLRQLRLKKDNTVYLYNGKPKKNQSAQYAVLDIPVGKEDLQQCADAVMRIRAEYLFHNKKFSEIIFADNNGKAYQFNEPYTSAHLQQYLKTVFSNCGTASLSKQLKSITLNEIQPGDVFIKGGFPGHAVIVTDVAVNKEGKKIFMLAQSYMPAQDIHILKNPNLDKDTPWYLVEKDNTIYTPEWVFYNTQLKRW